MIESGNGVEKTDGRRVEGCIEGGEAENERRKGREKRRMRCNRTVRK